MIKLVYVAAGGLAAAAIAVFILLGSGLIFPSQQERPELEVIPPVATVSDVSVERVENDSAQVTVKFAMSNPNQRSIYIETVQYDLFVNNKQITQGQWGEVADAFVVGSEGLLIVSEGSSPIPAVTTTVTRSNHIEQEWDSIVDGSATFTITGTSAYRLTQANLQTSVDESPFNLTFP